MEDFEEKFKVFQVSLMESAEERDPSATITYQRDRSTGGIVVQITSDSFGIDKFMIYPTIDGGIDFIRVFGG